MFGKAFLKTISGFVLVLLAMTVKGESLNELFRAAKNGNAEAQYKVALRCEFAYIRGGRKDKKLMTVALDMYSRAMEQGHADAFYASGLIFLRGVSGACVVKKNPAVAAGLFKAAAEKGHSRAQYQFALCLSSGNGVERDQSEAVKWWRKAAAQGNAEAKEMLKKNGVSK